MKTRRFVFAAACAAIFTLTHDTQAARAVRAAAQSAQEIEDIGEITPARGDGKGVQEPAREGAKFRMSLSGSGNYTSNATLSGNHGNGDFLFIPGLEVGVKVPLGKYFTFDFAAKVDSGIYARFDERSFIGYSALATIDYRPRPNLPRIYIGAEPYRYDSFDQGDLITQAIGVTVGTDWGIGFNNGNSLAFVGYNFSHYFSDPGIDDRHVHKAILGLTHRFHPRLFGQFYYQFQFSDFEISRHDKRHIVGLSFIYQIQKHLFATATASLVDNDSTQNRASYQSVNAGLGLTLKF